MVSGVILNKVKDLVKVAVSFNYRHLDPRVKPGAGSAKRNGESFTPQGYFPGSSTEPLPAHEPELEMTAPTFLTPIT